MDCKILFFNDISHKQLELVGGKGLNLGIMANAGIPVPNGFCVTSQVYKDFISLNGLEALLENNSNGTEIRAIIKQSSLPDYLESHVADALTHFEADTFFSVRSSATAEDLPYASFAGQQDTYLNISGIENILCAIRNCWASLYTDRAIVYRKKQGIDTVYMSVIVQKMVMSEMSGIMFTADPVSESRNIISIDAGFGLGEALVSGIVTPDIYTCRKESGEIIDKLIAHKVLAIVPDSKGGTRKVSLEPSVAGAQVLEDDTIRKLAHTGKLIEDLYKSPQDIEWCIEKGKIFIVQSRAITSLFPLPQPSPKDSSLHPYISFGHAQMMLAPMSPAGIDIIRMFFRNDDVPFENYKPVFIKQSAGRIFIDASSLMQYRLLGKPFAKIIGNVDLLISQSLLALMERPNFHKRIAKTKGVFMDFVKFVHTIPPKTIWKILRGNTQGTIDRVNAFSEKELAYVSQRIRSAHTLRKKLTAIYNNVNKFKHIIKNIAPFLLPGLIAMKRLKTLEHKLLGTDIYAAEVIKGPEGNVTTDMGLISGDLADFVRKSPLLRKEFEDTNYNSFYQRIVNVPGENAFKDMFNNFMEKYGVRAAGEIDIAAPRWTEHPEPLICSILSMTKGMSHGQHREEFSDTKRKALKAANDFVEAVRGKHGNGKAKKVAKYINIVRDCLPAREHPKFIMMHMFYMAKKVLLEEADRLVSEGRLENREDIFMLGLWELDRAVADGEDIKAIVTKRKEEYGRYAQLTPPRVVTGDGEIIKSSYKKHDIPAEALIGVGVSSGVIEGVARVITDPNNAVIEKGEILVAPYTDPGWTTLFINAAGLVTEVGGLLTHGTVVAREYGIPAVVGCENATSLIKTGQKIKIDGNNGYVLILEG